jgi:PAS domain S-box-containing protein
MTNSAEPTSTPETDQLLEIAARMNAATGMTDLLALLADPETTAMPAWAALYQVIELDEAGNPAWGEVSQVWARGNAPSPLPVGMRFFATQFPFTALWVKTHTAPLLVEDVLTNDRFDKNSQSSLSHSRSRALAVIPLPRGDTWVGFVTISWDKPHPFSNEATRIYQAVGTLAAPVVENLRLRRQQQQRLDTTLFDISRRLSTARDEDELLKTLTQPSLESGVAVSLLAYIDNDVKNEPAWAEIAATWQKENSRATADLVAAIWAQIIAGSQQTGQPLTSTGGRYALPEFPFTSLWFASSTEPQVIANAAADHRLGQTAKNVMRQANLQAMAVVPLTLGDQWVGVISLFWAEPHAFAESEIATYRAFTTLASPAIATRRQLNSAIATATTKSQTAYRFQTLAEHSDEPLAICNPDGEFLFANDRFTSLLRFADGAPLGKHLATLLPEAAGNDTPPFPADVTDTVQLILAGWQGQRPIRRNDGRVIPADLVTFILAETGDTVVTLNDRTEAEQVAAWPVIQQRLLDTMAGTTDHQAELQAYLYAASEATGLERARLYQLQPDSGDLALLAHHGFTPDELAQIIEATQPAADEPIPAGSNLAAILTGENPQYCGPSELADASALPAGDSELTAAAIVPVYRNQTMVAVLHLGSRTLETMPPFAPIPLQTIAGLLSALYRQQQAQTELAATHRHATLRLDTVRAETEDTLVAARETLHQEMDASQQRLEQALVASREQAETQLRETETHARETFGQILTLANTQMQTANSQASESLHNTQNQAAAELKNLQNRLDATLKQNSSRVQNDLEAVRTEAGAALATLQQANHQLEADLDSTRQQAQADLETAQLQAQANLEATRDQAKADLATAQSAAAKTLHQTQQQTAARLVILDKETRAASEAAQAHLQTDLQQAAGRLNNRLTETTALFQADLEATRQEAETALNTLRQTNQQLHTDLEATRDQAKADLESAQLQAQANLEAARDQAKADLESAQLQAQANLEATRDQAKADLDATQSGAAETLRQTSQQLHTDLETTRNQAKADLDAARTHVQAGIETVRRQAHTELETTRQEAETALNTLRQTNQQLHTDLKTTRQQAKADLDASHQRAKANLELAHQQTQAKMEAVRQKSNAEIEAVQAEMVALRQQTEQTLENERQSTAAELQAERQRSAAALTLAAAQSQTEMETTHTQTSRQLQTVQAQAELALVEARTQAHSSLQSTSQNAMSRLTVIEEQATNTLKSVAARQAQLINTLAEWVCRIDTEGNIVTTNSAVEPLLGYTTAELIGTPLFNLVHPDQQQDIQNRFVQTMVQQSADSGGGWSNITLTWLGKDGSPRYTQNSLIPDFNEQGYLIGFYTTNVDLTPLHLARQENRGLARHIRAATELSAQISAAPTPEKLLDLFVEGVQSRLEFDHVQIFVFDTASQTLTLRAPQPQQAPQPLPLNQGTGLVTAAARAMKTVATNDVTRHADFAPDPRFPDTLSQLTMPLIIAGQLWGVVDIQDNRTNRFSQADIDLLNTLVAQLNNLAANLELQKQQRKAQQEQVNLKQRIVDVQKETVQTLPTPVIPLMGQMIAVPLIGKLDPVRVNNIIHALVQGSRQHHARAVMLDVSGIPAIDATTVEHLNKIIDSAKAQGMQTMVSGLPEDIADQVKS